MVANPRWPAMNVERLREPKPRERAAAATVANAASATLRPLLAWPFVLLAAAIVALALGGVAYTTHQPPA